MCVQIPPTLPHKMFALRDTIRLIVGLSIAIANDRSIHCYPLGDFVLHVSFVHKGDQGQEHPECEGGRISIPAWVGNLGIILVDYYRYM